ncbi:MAG: M23 family metallopeptidase [Bacteriovoracaceae bacterium]|nr:M23 family metallopeptidase [Bacteriovoracaceae bacterium]
MNTYHCGVYILMGALLLSCGSHQVKQIEPSSKTQEKDIQIVKEWPKTVEPQKVEIKAGEVSLLAVPGSFNSEGSLECNDKAFKFYVSNNKLISFISETYFSKEKPYSCFYSWQGEKVKVADFYVVKKDFPSERLNVDKKRVFLNKKDAARAARENKLRAKAYASSPNRPLFFEPFILPIESFVTSIYGSKRIFNKKKQTQHLGTDYRAAVGVPIKAANRGKVVISRDFFYTGNTIIIDHGLGIFTMYGHLSKRHVQEGEVVTIGDIIGLAGATGRVTGPHLHWGVTVNGFAIEGDSLVSASEGLPR